MSTVVHEVNQMDFGGVEKVVRSIIKHDKKNVHKIITYKDGPFRSKLEEVGAEVMLYGKEDIDMRADVVHIHTGGAVSKLGQQLCKDFPIIETIHSPCRSAMMNNEVTQRVGVSEAVAKRNQNCITITNGLEFDELESSMGVLDAKKKFAIPEGLPVVGRLGRIGPDKRPEEWILACYELQRRGVDFIPVIVGDEARDCKGYRGKLKLLCESLPLKNVIWIPNQDNVSDVLQCMDVFLYPSPTEGFGLVIAEALYNNCAVVSYNTEVTHELFAGYVQLVNQDKGIKGLADSTADLLQKHELRDAYYGIGHEWVKSEYNAERMSLDYQDLYERYNRHTDQHDRSEAEHAVSA